MLIRNENRGGVELKTRTLKRALIKKKGASIKNWKNQEESILS